jgi:hypothetical protein
LYANAFSIRITILWSAVSVDLCAW